MSNNKLGEEVFDALLKVSLEELEDEEIDSAAREYETYAELGDFHPSRKFRRSVGRPAANSSVRRRWLRGGFAAAACLFFAFTALFVSRADRSMWHRLFLQDQGNYGRLQMSQESGWEHALSQVEGERIYYPGYLPEGYYLSDVEDYHPLVILWFAKGEDLIMLSFISLGDGSSSSMTIDTEDAVVEQVEFENGAVGFSTEKQGYVGIYMNIESDYITLESGDILKAELVEIASSLRKFPGTL